MAQNTSNLPRRRPGKHMTATDTATAQAAFLEAYRSGGMISPAARKAGVARQTVYTWVKQDPAFAELYAEAEQIANGIIRDEIWRRGVTGWVETQTTVEVDGDGVETRKTVKTHKYSDAMMRLIATARMPEFKERLDVTSNERQLGAYDAIASVALDPDKSAQATDLLKLIAGDSEHAGRPGVDSEHG